MSSTRETYFWTGGIEDMVLALKVEMPLRGQGKEKLPTRGQLEGSKTEWEMGPSALAALVGRVWCLC